MTETRYAIRTEGLTKKFGERIAVNSVNLQVRSGTAFGLLGPNGAGKTTLIRMLVGLVHASNGTIEVLDHLIPKSKELALAKVGAIVEEPRFHPFLSGRENLEIIASLRGRTAMSRIDDSLERVGLIDRAEDKVGGYSLGMRQRLGIARCLIVNPELMILDEPMNGLDPPGILEIRALIRSLVSEGKTVLISSHLLDEVEKTCDEVAILAQGNILASGSLESILAGTNGIVTLRTSSNQSAVEVIQESPLVNSVDLDQRGLKVVLSCSDDKADQALGELVRTVVTRGIDVFEVSQERASLESRFFEVTSLTKGEGSDSL